MIGQTEKKENSKLAFNREKENKLVKERKKNHRPLTHWTQNRRGSTLIIVKETPQIGQTE